MLDLFSGIGGFSYAMHSLFKTIAYCDIDETCHAILKRNMQLGRLDRAPIFEDVRNLKGQDLTLQPVLITAGFPCQDISGANSNAAGIDGHRSGLIREVFRLVDECPETKYVFLENSPNTMFRGGEMIVQSLANRGFYVTWLNVSASDIGAPHQRRRWFCVAFRDLKMEPIKTILKDPWDSENTTRLVPYQSDHQKKFLKRRCEVLGNSVVPQCIQVAWNRVNIIVTHPIGRTKSKKNVINLLTHRGLFQFPFPKSGLKRDFHLNLLHQGYHKSISHWGTPTVSVQHLYRTLTDRASTMLPSQIYYEVETQKYIQTQSKQNFSIDEVDKYWLINPQFVEWLMGFPQNWTLL